MQDIHVHTIFSDGKSEPEEIVKKAIEMGITTLGFSDHSYASCDEGICMPYEKIQAYIKEIHLLADKYKDKIEIRCGIEQDYFAEYPTDEFEYVIGSVHYVKVGDDYISIDYSRETFCEACNKYFNGDFYAFAELYFETVAALADKWNIDIIGHFDLITKFNEGGILFDEKNPRYIKAWKKAADILLKLNKPFEINMGAISRGYRTTPYPSIDIIDYIKGNGGTFILNSDSHHKDTLCFKFDEFKNLLY